ncbi:MAG: FadR family transcriptional regulator [Planctomycetes bacterium]|nr:FadR family transcriptional regulator [Planctomycetota bacterium]
MASRFCSDPETDSLTSRSIHVILQRIRAGALRPGERLPPQDVLARELGVSRTALREALKELSYRGIIDSRHGTGTFISDTVVSAEETLETRRILEPGIAELAAERATAAQIRDLEQVCAAMRNQVNAGNFQEFSELDLRFHRCIGEMSRNRALPMLLDTVRDMMLHQQNIVQVIPGAMERAYLYHLDIMQAIRERKSATAQAVMARHLEDVIFTLRTTAHRRQRS